MFTNTLAEVGKGQLWNTGNQIRCHEVSKSSVLLGGRISYRGLWRKGHGVPGSSVEREVKEIGRKLHTRIGVREVCQKGSKKIYLSHTDSRQLAKIWL